MPDIFHSPDDNMPGDQNASNPGHPDVESSLAAALRKLEIRAAQRQHKRRVMVNALAAVLIPGGIITSLYLYSARSSKINPEPVISQSKAVGPADSSMRLVLADGQTIMLDHVRNDDTLDVVALHIDHIAANTAGLNTLYTPRGRKICLSLPDGTLSWLNNETSFRFPSAFAGPTRDVEVTGEVYLEVAKDPKHPFIAFARQNDVTTRIDVLGTSFNISAYPDESTIRTTVTEGRVRVSSQGQSKTLVANEQMTTGAGGLFQYTQNIDTRKTIGWQQGELRFDGDSLTKVLRILARRYKEDIQNDIPPGPLVVIATLEQNISLDQALDRISNHKNVFKYQRIGQKMIVSL